MIRKCFEPTVRHCHPKGDSVIGDFRKRYDEKGNSIYVRVGDIDIPEFVNSFAAGASLQCMLERYKLLPPRELLACINNQQGISADLSDLPSDFTEAVIRANDFAISHPELSARVRAGESFENIVKSILESKLKESEVSSDGSTESSDE